MRVPQGYSIGTKNAHLPYHIGMQKMLKPLSSAKTVTPTVHPEGIWDEEKQDPGLIVNLYSRRLIPQAQTLTSSHTQNS